MGGKRLARLIVAALFCFTSTIGVGMNDNDASRSKDDIAMEQCISFTRDYLSKLSNAVFAHTKQLDIRDARDFLAVIMVDIAIQETYLKGFSDQILHSWPTSEEAIETMLDNKIEPSAQAIEQCSNEVKRFIATIDQDAIADPAMLEATFTQLCIMTTDEFLSSSFDNGFAAIKETLVGDNFHENVNDVFAIIYRILSERRGEGSHPIEKHAHDMLEELMKNMMREYFKTSDDLLDDLIRFGGKSPLATAFMRAEDYLQNLNNSIFERTKSQMHDGKDFLALLLAYVAVEDNTYLLGFTSGGLSAWNHDHVSTCDMRTWSKTLATIKHDLQSAEKISEQTWLQCEARALKMLPPDDHNASERQMWLQGFMRLHYMATEEFLAKRFDRAFSTAKKLLAAAPMVNAEDVYLLWNRARILYSDRNEEPLNIYSYLAFGEFLQRIMTEQFGATEDMLEDLLSR